MSDISTLLDLPVTSSGFTSIKASPTQSLDGSPPRKAARMEGDSDSGSASRSRDLANNGELLILKVVGEPSASVIALPCTMLLTTIQCQLHCKMFHTNILKSNGQFAPS